MQIRAGELVAILELAVEPIEIRDCHGRIRCGVPVQIAIELAKSKRYVGVGNRRRIRFLDRRS